MPDITNAFVRTVGRHFLSISCVQTHNRLQTARVFSGFLVDVLGSWFVVTAGHILRDIEAAIDAGDTFDIWRFDDQTARDGGNFGTVPFHFELNDWLVVEDSNIGLDYAVMPLDPGYIRPLEAGGAEPIRENAWGNHLQEHDYWALIGIPSESIAYDGENIITARFVVIPLEDTADVPEGAGDRARNQFYAKLDKMGNVEDIDGLSGGPIFALKKVDDEWKYRVIGVQSAWYPQSKVTVACPVVSLFDEMKSFVESLREELGAT